MNQSASTDMYSSYSYQEKRRLPFVDLAKCIALVWVIWEHTEANYMMRPVDNMILPVFWICSGYTTHQNFVLHRKLKLIAYYFFLSAICVFFTLTHFDTAFTWDSLWGILYARFCIYDAPVSASNPGLFDMTNTVLWFIPSLFTSNCVFKVLVMPRSFKWQALLCVISLVIGSVADLLPVLLPWSIDSAFVFGVMICIGFWLRKYRVIEKSDPAMALALVIAYLCMDNFTGPTNPSLRDYGANWPSLMITAPIGVTALLTLCNYFDKTLIAKLAVMFDREALFIFGLQSIFIILTVERTAWVVSSWKARVALDLIMCFAGGFIVGRLYRFLTGLFKTILAGADD